MPRPSDHIAKKMSGPQPQFVIVALHPTTLVLSSPPLTSTHGDIFNLISNAGAARLRKHVSGHYQSLSSTVVFRCPSDLRHSANETQTNHRCGQAQALSCNFRSDITNHRADASLVLGLVDIHFSHFIAATRNSADASDKTVF